MIKHGLPFSMVTWEITKKGNKHIPIVYEVITEVLPQITHILKHLLIFSFLNVALPINFKISSGTETQEVHFTLKGASASYQLPASVCSNLSSCYIKMPENFQDHCRFLSTMVHWSSNCLHQWLTNQPLM